MYLYNYDSFNNYIIESQQEITIQTGVNYDYIIALKKRKKTENVYVAKYRIKRHEYEIDQLLKFVDDDNVNVSDVYDFWELCLNDCTTIYNDCIAHQYTDTYIKPLSPLNLKNSRIIEILQNEIAKSVKSRVRALPYYERNKIKVQKIKNDVTRNYTRKYKKRLIRCALNYIYAMDYNNAIRKFKIKDQCIVFSNERHGDGRGNGFKGYHIEHKITDDISIRIETNFCYGSSSYFNVIVTYKGIELLPYSVWVRYYYAGYNHLLRCTRSYKVSRSSWDICMKWVAKFVNSSINNPESFIHNEIMTEVKGLMSGLEDIFSLNTNTFERRLIVKKRTGDSRYIGIIGARHADEDDFLKYQIAPTEIQTIYRMEKICVALLFLDSLRKVCKIYSEISKYIDRIIEMNQIILPDVESLIQSLKIEIRTLNNKLFSLEFNLKENEKSCSRFEKRLEIMCSRANSKQELPIIREKFDNQYPKYPELRIKIEELKSKIDAFKKKKEKRESVLQNLNWYENLILIYAK